MKKRLFATVAVLLLMFIFAGCGGSVGPAPSATATPEPTPEYVDQKFLDTFVAGLNKRASDDIAFDGSYEACQRMLSYESDTTTYKNAIFADDTMAKLAKDYIAGLEKQEGALDYYHGDQVKFTEVWEEGRYDRAIAIIELADTYDLGDKISATEEFRSLAKVAQEERNLTAGAQKLVDDLEFEKTESNYGWTTYQSVVENTTNTTFESFNVTLSLLDKDGVNVGTAYVYTSNWSPGQKARFEFQTDKAFKTIEKSDPTYMTTQ